MKDKTPLLTTDNKPNVAELLSIRPDTARLYTFKNYKQAQCFYTTITYLRRNEKADFFTKKVDENIESGEIKVIVKRLK